MAGTVVAVASTDARIEKPFEQTVDVEALVGIVGKDLHEPSVRLNVELAAVARTLPKMDKFASVVAVTAAV